MGFFFHRHQQKDFLSDMNMSLKPKQYTVVVIYNDGYKKEYSCIEHPWNYIAKLKQNPSIKTAYIK